MGNGSKTRHWSHSLLSDANSITDTAQISTPRVALFHLSLVRDRVTSHRRNNFMQWVHGSNNSKIPALMTWGRETELSNMHWENCVMITDSIKKTTIKPLISPSSPNSKYEKCWLKFEKMKLKPNWFTDPLVTIQEEENPSLIKERAYHQGLPIYSDLWHQTLVLILSDTIEE